ncbi:MAG: heavy-metal-associated domain-containing protein [Akkermansiaceae bacterium]
MKLYLFFAAILGLTLTGFADEKHHVEINAKARDAFAAQALQKQKKTVVIYARGLVCESCAIGIRKKLQRLAFVDTKKPDKGIVMDPKTQLVTVSLNDKAIDPASISKAIRGAGYDPVSLYQVVPGHGVVKAALPK